MVQTHFTCCPSVVTEPPLIFVVSVDAEPLGIVAVITTLPAATVSVTYIVVACIAMACTVMAYIVMAYIVMAYIAVITTLPAAAITSCPPPPSVSPEPRCTQNQSLCRP